MSRRNPKENKSKLSEIINLYKAGKDQENALKKSNASMNEEIKAGMKDLGVTEFDTDLWTAKITTKTKESFDEEKAIEIKKVDITKDGETIQIQPSDFETLTILNAFDIK